MRKKVLLLVVAVMAVTAGCKKTSTDNTPQGIKSVNDIKVPSGFLWQSSREVAFTATVTDSRFGSSKFTIAIYDGDPYNGGNLISSGAATTSTPYSSKVALPNQLTRVYITKTAPDGSKIITPLNVSGNTASATFGATDVSVAQREERRSNQRTTAVDCSSGCTSSVTVSSSNVTCSAGQVVCITGNNITVSFNNVNGGTVRVCGTNVTLQNLSLSGSAQLLITSSGSATASNINMNSSTCSIDNEGTLTANIPIGGIFTNNGTYTNNGDLNLNASAGAFTNNGTMTVNGSFNAGAPVSPVNSGSLTITGSFQQNSSSVTFINNCSMKVGSNYNQSGPVKNYGLIKVSGTTQINSGELGLYNGAMFLAVGTLIDNATIKGYGATSLLKMNGLAVVNLGGGFNGALQVSSALTTILGSLLTGGATLGSSLYIATTGCNSEGNGTATIADADGDGVADSLDAYPADPTKAYNNYYPSSTTSGTVAFEDNWPAKGDFDLNDVVMSYRYKVVTNASNHVVAVTGTYALQATGGNNGNGFAVMFPVTSANISGLTGGTQQTGQANAVVTLFTNMRSETSIWNTVPGVAYGAPIPYSVSFNVANGPRIDTFGLSSYNPFIMNGAGQEVHLAGHAPSSLANAALFGTKDDNTSVAAGRYYVTATGLPFALDVPVPFSYPVEDTDITKAYLHFGGWAQSGGSTYADWYSNTAADYRNAAKIYAH